MSDSKKIGKLGMNAKTRVIVAVVAAIGVAGGIFAIWYHHHKKSEFIGSASVTNAPNIQSIPGAGNPSDQYVATQNRQNNLLEQQARKHAGSAVPTITRPSFIGNPNAFGILPSAKNGASSKPKACSIKKVVVMFRPNPANCSIPNLKMARKAGVTAEELACQGCSLQALKMAGYTAGDLKNVGYDAQQLKAAGYSLGQLEAAGFNAKNLKNAGYTANQLANVGFTKGQLAAAGFGKKNCSVAKLRKEREKGVSATTLRKQGCGLAALKAAGYTAAQLRAAGFTAKQLKDAGFTAKQLKDAGFSAAQLKAADFTAKQLKNAGFSATALKKAGFSAAALKNAGFSNKALKAAGFTAAQIKAADAASKVCNVTNLKKERLAGVSATELRNQGCGLAALKAAGFTAAQLKAAGFTAKQLKDAGFTAAQLKAAGFSAKQLKDAGFSAAALKKAGFSAAALKDAGFSAAALKNAGYSAAQLKAAGFSAKQLRDAGFSAKALKNAGFSAAQLKTAGFNAGQLAAAGFSAKQLKAAGFTAKQLRNAGFNAAQLKAAGYTAKQLKKAGYSDGDLLRAGFTPKQSGYASVKVAQHVAAKQKAVSNGASIASQMGADDSSAALNAGTPEAKMAALIRQEQARMSAQQRQDSIQQLTGAMSMQANRMVSEWGDNQQQKMENAIKQPSNSGEGSAAGSASDQQPPGTILKAGSVMFAVLDTSIDTDEKSPIMATIVDGPLKGSKLIGQFTRVNKRVLLSFNLLSDPHYYKSIPLNAVAIDPNTARTAISGQVNNHYLLKYGTVFATAFLSGLSNAILQSNSSPQCSLFGCVNNVSPLNTRQQITVGLGTAGEKIADDYSNKFENMPPTIKIKGGTGIGILIMSDLKLPTGAVPPKQIGFDTNKSSNSND